jgi:hypothetical protein
LQMGSCFLSRPTWITNLLFYASPIIGMTGVGHHAKLFFHCDGVLQTFFAQAGLELWFSQS